MPIEKASFIVQLVKESACNAGDPDSTPGSGISSREENSNPVKYSCLENPMDRGVRWATVRGDAESDLTEVTEHTRTAI